MPSYPKSREQFELGHLHLINVHMQGRRLNSYTQQPRTGIILQFIDNSVNYNQAKPE